MTTAQQQTIERQHLTNPVPARTLYSWTAASDIAAETRHGYRIITPDGRWYSPDNSPDVGGTR